MGIRRQLSPYGKGIVLVNLVSVIGVQMNITPPHPLVLTTSVQSILFNLVLRCF
jgi:hypothetical protein